MERFSLLKKQTPGYQWYRASLVMIVLQLLMICLTFQHYGVGYDATTQHEYGRRVLAWYKSGFTNRSALTEGNQYFYGGFYQVWMGLIQDFFSEWHTYMARNFFTALFGLMGVIAAGKITLQLTGRPQSVCLVLALMCIHPVFYGHSFFNSKDIPFATAYCWSILYLIRLCQSIPNWRWSTVIKLGFAMGVTLGIRSGGFILYGYLAMVLSLAYLLEIYDHRYSIKKAFSQSLKIIVLSVGISYVFMLVFWPWGQINPLVHPLKSLSEFTKFKWVAEVFFQGEYILGSELPWYFLPVCLLIQNTTAFLLGLVLAILAGFLHLKRLRNSDGRKKALVIAHLVFFALFPLVYVVLKKSVVYDNYRHLMFVVPILAVIATLGLDWGWVATARIRFVRYILIGIVTVSLLGTLKTMVQLHPYEYAYYNWLVGGVRKGYDSFENDYHAISFRDLMDKLDRHLDYSKSDVIYKVFSRYPGPVLEVICRDMARFEFAPVEEADFIVSMTRWDLDKQFQGKPFLDVRRFDKPFGVVKDIRPAKFFTDLKYSRATFDILDEATVQIFKLSGVPEDMYRRTCVLQYDAKQVNAKFGALMVPRHNTLVYARHREGLEDRSFKQQGWKVSLRQGGQKYWVKQFKPGEIILLAEPTTYLITLEKFNEG